MILSRFRPILSGALLVVALFAWPLHRAPAHTSAPEAASQAPPPDAPMQITWEVKNRFRLFREQRDFDLHADSMRGRSILASEDALEVQSEGRGWARNMVNRLCIDLRGRIATHGVRV